MKGIIAKAFLALCGAGALAGVEGCNVYRNIVDPCYPERYEFAARQEVIGATAPQVFNGHVLDQTVWNYHFEYDAVNHVGTDKLTPGGLDFLAYLARRRPSADPVIYLQTAQDITYDPADPDALADKRARLDGKRIQAIQNYLTAQTAGRHASFQVVVHDPAEVGISAVEGRLAVQSMYRGSQGTLGTAGTGGGPSNVGGGIGAGVGGGTADAPGGSGR